MCALETTGVAEPRASDTTPRPTLVRPGLPGRVLASSTMAGGVFFGGIFVAVSSVFDPQVATSVSLLTPTLFTAGAGLGLVHGALLGFLGRPAATSAASAVASLSRGAVWTVPGLPIAVVAALGTGVTMWAVSQRATTILLAVALAWLLALAISVWCTLEARAALAHALARWPARRQGVPLATVTFLVLVVYFIASRPTIWWTDMRVTRIGAVLLALGVTLWVAVPIEVLGLHLLGRYRRGR